MQIMMLTDLYPPVIGGLEIHVRNLSAGLVALGHTVSVVTLAQPGTPPFEIDERGVRIYRISGTMQRAAGLFSDAGRRFAPPFPDPEAMLAIKRIIAVEQPTIIHAHNWLVHSLLPLKRWSRARLIVSLHNYSLACARKDLTYRGAPCDGPGAGKCLACGAAHYGTLKGYGTVLTHRLASAAERALVDYFLPVSEAVAHGNGLTTGRQRYQVVPNFLPDDAATEKQSADDYLTQLPEGPFLLFVGALIPAKGIEVLLAAYAGLTAAPPLVLIGATWPGSPTTFPPNVITLRDWPHHAVMAAWRRSLLGLVPSIWGEPCPTVALEAMAAGKPLIASRIGGLTTIVAEDETGLLVPPGDVAAWRTAIQTLLADPDRAARLGEAGRERVHQQFAASAVVPQIAGIYQQLLNEPTQREAQAPAIGGQLPQ